MGRLIDADALKAAVRVLMGGDMPKPIWSDGVLNAIDAAPTVLTGERLDLLTRREDALKRVNKAYDRALSELAAAPRWIDAYNGTLPPDDEKILCLTRQKNGGWNIVMGYCDGHQWHTGKNTNVTHWMPLPEPPEEVRHETD